MKEKQKTMSGFNPFKILSSLFLLSCFASSALALDLSKADMIDLSHDYSEETIYWPTADGFKKTTVFEGINDKGFYYSAYNYTSAEHGGTHLDAPVHFAEGRKPVDQLPLSQLIAPAAVMHIAEKIPQDRNYQVSKQDILEWEKQYGQIPQGSMLLIDTGSAKFWPDRVKYMGTDERGADAVAKLVFPGLHPDAAQFLVDERNILALGFDTPSIDFGGSTMFETHRILSKKNIFGLENLNNLDQLPAVGAWVMALPMKIKGGSGAPVRVVGLKAKD